MVKVPEYWIIKKDGQWLMTSRSVLADRADMYVFSNYTYDAERYEFKRDAKRMAEKVGGCVYRFVPAISKVEQVTFPLPEGAKCDICRSYTPFDGICRNPESEYYQVPVSCKDCCCDWRAKQWTKKTD